MPKNPSEHNLNREISWLHFNERVLQEANDSTNPLIERIKFLGIFSNNRDEFFRVRVATLKRYVKVKEHEEFKKLKIKPKKVLKEIDRLVSWQEKKFTITFLKLLRELEQENIFMLNNHELDPQQGLFVKKYFHEEVRPHLFPIILNNETDFSTLKDMSIYLAIVLSKSDESKPDKYAFIQLPTENISRFLILPEKGGKQSFILLDDVVRYCLSDIFAIFGYDKYKAYTVKFTRDAEFDIDNDVAKSFLESIQESLKQRKKGLPVRFVYDENIPNELLEKLMKKFKIKSYDTLRKGGRYHNFKDFMAFPRLGNSTLHYKALPPLPHPDLEEKESILNAIKKKDIMLHYPYQSFQYIIDLLREASIDPKVKSIRVTLYRAASDSSVINALINAARNGKYVTVFLELQARFDEEANINWSQLLQEEGVKVIQTIPGIKVHSKMILIRRKEGNKSVYYANLSTGNFNESTAKIYADDSLLTADPRITEDVRKTFILVESRFTPPEFKSLIVSPFNQRNHFIHLLDNEIKNASEGKDAWAIIKLNSLVDAATVDKLYEASQKGVKIKLIIRGICILIPGIPGISDNIEVISILDRFLEHSRVFVFANDNDPLYYISSADWMIRNFDHRIEISVPIYSESIQKELWDMLQIQLNDNVKARLISKDRPNIYKRNNNPPIRSQAEIYKYFKHKLYPKHKQ